MEDMDMQIAELVKARAEKRLELKTLLDEMERKKTAIEAEIAELSRLYVLGVNNCDLDKVAVAEQVMTIWNPDNYGPTGDDSSVVSDAILWFAGALNEPYKNLRREMFAVKNYDRWSHQRHDSEYGMGPRHGSLVWGILLNRDFRDRDIELTSDQRDACIYYLNKFAKGEFKAAAQEKAA